MSGRELTQFDVLRDLDQSRLTTEAVARSARWFGNRAVGLLGGFVGDFRSPLGERSRATEFGCAKLGSDAVLRQALIATT
jgi:hypothetical protein